MNDAAANPPGESWPAGPESNEGWSRARWLAVIALVLATHVALILLFGEKKEPPPRPVTNVPQLTLADSSDELLALEDPTLFALPHQRDFVGVDFLKLPPVSQPMNRYTELPRPLPFSADGLGAAFGQFMQTNLSASRPFDFKPVTALSMPTLPADPLFTQNSTMQFEGELARRKLPGQISLTNWPFADALAPGKVQVLVDAAGNVVSAVLLESSGHKEADEKALEVARGLRFAPTNSLTFGRVTFNWHTVPETFSP